MMITNQEFIELIKNNLNDLDYISELAKQYPVQAMETLFVEPKIGAFIKLNPAQKKVIDLVLNSKDVFLLGSRQIAGKSTIALYLAIFLATFYKHYYVYYISLEASRQCADFLQNVERVLDSFPFTITHKRSSMNNTQIVLGNGSMIMTAAVARRNDLSSIAKSRTAHLVIIDEFSDIKNNAELLSLISATMAATRKLSTETKLPTSIMLISNAFEISNEHHQFTYNLWMKSVEGLTNYHPVLFYYRALMTEEEADKFIEQERRRGIPTKQILINYECYFTRSNNSFIDDDELLQQLYLAKKEPITIPIDGINRTHLLKIYDYNKISDVRYISIDTATKYGSDFYAIVGLTKDGELILEYNDKLAFDEAVDLIIKLDNMFSNSEIIIERNMGAHLIEFLENKVKLYKEDENKPGFYTNEKKKQNMFVILKEFLYRYPHKLYSSSILRQLLTLKSYKSSFRSDEHDDLVMAYAIGIYVLENNKLKEELNYNNEIIAEKIDSFATNVFSLDNTRINNINNGNNNINGYNLSYGNTYYYNDNSNNINPFASLDLFLLEYRKK